MKNMYCDECGKLVAKIETGSSIQKNATMTCGDCNGKNYSETIPKPNAFNNNNKDYAGEDGLNMLKNMFGFK